MAACRKYPLGRGLLNLLIPNSLRQKRVEHRRYSTSRILHRLDAVSGKRADFVDYMLAEAEGKSPMSRAEVLENANVLLIGGSETTATALSGLTYLLCQNKPAYDRVKSEICSTFGTEDEITPVNTKETPFLQACIDEALRLYPPIPIIAYRVIRSRGEMVGDHYLPAGVSAPGFPVEF